VLVRFGTLANSLDEVGARQCSRDHRCGKYLWMCSHVLSNAHTWFSSYFCTSDVKRSYRFSAMSLALGGDIYPALGGDYPGNFAYSSLQSLASNVTGITVPLSGHWIPEEEPQFVIDQLFKFFGK
jgi:hypothetical protein